MNMFHKFIIHTISGSFDFDLHRLAACVIIYHVPKVLEATVCIFAMYINSNKRISLFGVNPMTYTHCQERFDGYQTLVGGFDPSGLHIDTYELGHDEVGIAALRKF